MFVDSINEHRKPKQGKKSKKYQGMNISKVILMGCVFERNIRQSHNRNKPKGEELGGNGGGGGDNDGEIKRESDQETNRL